MRFHATMFIGIITILALACFVLAPFLKSVGWSPSLKVFALYSSVLALASAVVLTASRANK